MNLSIQHKNKKDIFNIRWWQMLNILSIDVVIGAVAGGVMAVRLLHVNPGFALWIILPLSVWIIYTTDHLIDGFRLKNSSHTVRHFFHYYYSKQTGILIILLSVVNIVLIALYLKRPVFYFGIYAGFITVVYLIIVYFSKNIKSFLLQKEFFVAVIYSAGIWGGPAALMSYKINTPLILLIAGFFFIVWAAVLILSVYEVNYDKLDKHNTFAVNFGVEKTVSLIYFLMAAVFIICSGEIVFITNSEIDIASKILMIMGLLLLIILNFPAQLRQNNVYRTLIELVFWLPGLFLFF
jgi:4-hydroxybenzoate polyprenyltransferase